MTARGSIAAGSRCRWFPGGAGLVALILAAACGSSSSTGLDGGRDAAAGDARDSAASVEAATDVSVATDGAIDTTDAAGDADATGAPDAADAPLAADAGSSEGGPAKTRSVFALAISAAQIAGDSLRRRLYVSVAGAAPQYANTLVTLDATTGTVLSSAFAGSDPDVLALSDDASTLWIGIDGALSMRSVTLTNTPPLAADFGPMHQVPQQLAQPTLIAAMVTLPGAPTSVAVSLFSSGLWELAILDNTVARHTAAVFDQVPSTLVAGAAGSLFGISSQAQFLTGTISATGVTSTVFASLLQTPPRQLVYRDNRVYTNAGEIVDVTSPAHPAVMGHFTPTGVVALGAPNRLIVVPSASGALMQVLDTTTLQTTGSVPLPSDPPGNVSNLTYISPDIVAYVVTQQDPTTLRTVSRSVIIVRDPSIADAN